MTIDDALDPKECIRIPMARGVELMVSQDRPLPSPRQLVEIALHVRKAFGDALKETACSLKQSSRSCAAPTPGKSRSSAMCAMPTSSAPMPRSRAKPIWARDRGPSCAGQATTASRPGYTPTPDADPAWLYADTLVGIVPERGLNNGQPSAHACWIAAAAPATGEHVVHVGAGVGYYSAIMAHMVGATGSVTAIEYDPQLAGRAAANFAQAPNVEVVQGDGSVTPFAPADVIYVNAGASRPADAWLDRLKEGGRLVLPLTTARNFTTPPAFTTLSGAVFAITRRGGDYDAWLRRPDRRVPLRRHAGRGVRAGPRGGVRQGRIPRREAAASDG